MKSVFTKLNTFRKSSSLRTMLYSSALLLALTGSGFRTSAQTAGALHFDASDDMITVDGTDFQFGTGAYSAEAWFRTSNSTGQGCIATIRPSLCGATTFWSLHIDHGRIKMEAYGSGGTGLNEFRTNTDGEFSDGNWHHVAITRSGANAAIYVDGSLRVSSTGFFNGNVNSGTSLYIGRGCGTFDGSLDEIRIWSRALTGTEITNHYSCEIATTGTNLVANYHFNQGTVGANNSSVTTLIDATGLGHTGTLANFGYTGSTSNWIAGNSAVNGIPCDAKQWTGGSSTWSTGTNWNPNGAPTSTDDVYIPSSGTQPTITTGTVNCRNLTIASGATVTVSGGTLQIAGNATNNGTFTNSGSGTIAYTGSSAQAMAAVDYVNLTINNAAGVTLSGSSLVSGALTLTSGVLTIGAAGTLQVQNGTTIARTSGSITNSGIFRLNGDNNPAINNNVFTSNNLGNVKYGSGGDRTLTLDAAGGFNYTIGNVDALLNVGSAYAWIHFGNNNVTFTGTGQGDFQFSVGSPCGTLSFTGAGTFSSQFYNPGSTPINSITINKSSGTVTLNANGILSLAGDLTVTSGTFASNGVSFTGTGAQNVTVASGATLTASMTINNSNGVSLSGSGTFTPNSITLTNGMLNTGTVTLSPSGITGGSSASYIKTNGASGGLRRTVAASAISFPVGNTSYNPITMSNSGTSDQFTVRVTDAIYNNGTDNTNGSVTGKAVNRTWNVTEGVAGGSNVSMTIQWNASDEFGDFNRNSLFVVHRNNDRWENYGAAASSASGSGPYTFTRTGITSFSPFGMGSTGFSPLPIHLGTLTGINKGKINELNWNTGMETADCRMEVEKSTDGKSFTTLTGVALKGSNSAYSINDLNAVNGNNYYRIRVTDADGSVAYSNTTVVFATVKAGFTFAPNPANDQINVVIEGNGQLNIISMNGQVMISKELTKGENHISLQGLSAGWYFVQYANNNSIETSRLLKQ